MWKDCTSRRYETSISRSEVNQCHRDFLRFLWYDSITADNPSMVAFHFTRILFGLNSSPFILEGALQMHMSKYDFTYHDIDLLRKWETNDSTIRDFLLQIETSYQLNLFKNCKKKGIRKVLALNWNSQRDEFLF